MYWWFYSINHKWEKFKNGNACILSLHNPTPLGTAKVDGFVCSFIPVSSQNGFIAYCLALGEISNSSIHSVERRRPRRPFRITKGKVGHALALLQH